MKSLLCPRLLLLAALLVGLARPACALDDEIRTPYPSYPEFSRRPDVKQAMQNAQNLIDAFSTRNVLIYDKELFDANASNILRLATIIRLSKTLVGALPTAARDKIEPPLEGVVAEATFAMLSSNAIALAYLEQEVVDVVLNEVIGLLPQSHNQFYMTLPAPTTKQGSAEWDMPLNTVSQLGIWIVPYHESRQVFSICDAIFFGLNGAQLSGKFGKLLQYLDPIKVAQLSKRVFSGLDVEIKQSAARYLDEHSVNLTVFNPTAISNLMSAITAGCSASLRTLPRGNYQPVDINDSRMVSVTAPAGSPVTLSLSNHRWFATGASPGMVAIHGQILSRKLYSGGTPTTFPMAIRVGGNQQEAPLFPPCTFYAPGGQAYKGLLEFGKCFCIDSECVN